MKTFANKILTNGLLLMAIVLFSRCETETPVAENEEELITTLEMTFSPIAGGEDVIFSIYDEDGDGATPPVYTNATLAANTDYSVTIEVRNDIDNENITTEVEEEGLDHQFFFETSVSLSLDFAYDDADANGDPIGINSFFYAGDASTGTMTVSLRHEADKAAEGAINGDPTNAGGETDIQATFDVVIE